MESYKNNFEGNGELSHEIAVQKEKNLLERFKGKAQKLAKIFMLISALSGGAMANEAHAQEELGGDNIQMASVDVKSERPKIDFVEAHFMSPQAAYLEMKEKNQLSPRHLQVT